MEPKTGRALASRLLGALGLLCGTLSVAWVSVSAQSGSALSTQSAEDADRKSAGCVTCHTKTDARTMHNAPSVRLGCTDCHGGDVTVRAAGNPGAKEYDEARSRAHVAPQNREVWASSANPVRAYTALLDESLEYVRFVNPGDLRAAPLSCGPCHKEEVKNVSKSMMTHSGMLYAAALYNNGVLPGKDALVGESYGPDGKPRMLKTIPPPHPRGDREEGRGAVPGALPPLGAGPARQPLPHLRARGTPQARGRPARSLRGAGQARQGALAARAGHLEPHGSRGAGRAEDSPRRPPAVAPRYERPPGRLPVEWLQRLPRGLRQRPVQVELGRLRGGGQPRFTQTADATIPNEEAGHPLKHAFTRSIPSSQCVTCHMHPGTNMVTTYLGYTWGTTRWTARPCIRRSPRPSPRAERDEMQRANPEGSSLRGLWSDRVFLSDVSTLNPKLKNTQFADFHGHGWVYRAVFKKDRKGGLLDAQDKPVAADDPDKFKKAVHLKDIHLEKGMHCVDCHFEQDIHGNGKLYGEPRAAVEIDCIDCHGTIKEAASLITSGPASTGTDLSALSTPFGEPRFSKRRGKITAEEHGHRGRRVGGQAGGRLRHPRQPGYSEKSALAKTILKDGAAGAMPGADSKALAHSNENMTCYACHSAWTTSCFGCHLSQTANQKKPNLHSEGGESRNWTSYNFQTLRDDIYFLARDGVVTKNRIAPARSACSRARVEPEPEPRVDLLAAADRVLRRVLGHLLLHLRAPHRAHPGDHGLHRLPRRQGRGQQRLDGRAPDAGHRLRELHRPLRVRGRANTRLRGGRWWPREMSPRLSSVAASPARVSRRSMPPHKGRAAGSSPRGPYSPTRGRGGFAPAPRGVPLRRPGQGEGSGVYDAARGPEQGLLGADRIGARVAAGPEAVRGHEGRHLLWSLPTDHDPWTAARKVAPYRTSSSRCTRSTTTPSSRTAKRAWWWARCTCSRTATRGTTSSSARPPSTREGCSRGPRR